MLTRAKERDLKTKTVAYIRSKAPELAGEASDIFAEARARLQGRIARTDLKPIENVEAYLIRVALQVIVNVRREKYREARRQAEFAKEDTEPENRGDPDEARRRLTLQLLEAARGPDFGEIRPEVSDVGDELLLLVEDFKDNHILVPEDRDIATCLAAVADLVHRRDHERVGPLLRAAKGYFAATGLPQPFEYTLTGIARRVFEYIHDNLQDEADNLRRMAREIAKRVRRDYVGVELASELTRDVKELTSLAEAALDRATRRKRSRATNWRVATAEGATRAVFVAWGVPPDRAKNLFSRF